MERPAHDSPPGATAAAPETAVTALDGGGPRPPGVTLLRAEELRVQYGRFLALAGVSLEVRAGELLGLVGPNGAGKTTLLRTLAGLQVPSAGAVWVFEKRLRAGEPDAADAMRHVGFTADEPPLYEAMTVRTFLRFVAAGYDSTGAEVDERIDFWLERLWLTEKADQPVRALSRGMRQRLGIARTLLPNPHVILLDEPAAGLDPAGRAQFRELLRSLREQGKALIVSSHILSDLADYCSHIAIMARGQVVRHGTVSEIAEDHAHAATYSVRLAARGEALAAFASVAESLAGVSAVAVKGQDRLEVVAEPGPQAAAELLAAMVRAGMPVCGFAVEGGGLEQAYLRSGIGQVD